MHSAQQHSRDAKGTHLDLSLRVDLGACYVVPVPDIPILTARSFLADFNLYRSPSIASVNGASADGLFSPLSRFYSTNHNHRVATADCHDTDTWAQNRKVHDTKLEAVAASPFLGSNNFAPSDYLPTTVVRNSPALMEPQSQGLQNVNRFSSVARQGDTILRPRNWTPFGAPGASNPTRPNVTNPQYLHEDLSEGRRRVGEILVRCGVINASGMPQISLGCSDICPTHPANVPVASNMAAAIHLGENDGILNTAIADWTSEWVHKLVIQPYLRGSFHFRYQGKSSGAPTSVSSGIRRVFGDVHNPLQVAIHTLWYISTLTGNGVQGNAPFLSVPIFRYLHNNGAFAAEDFMFRAFIICAMIGDKAINDTPLSQNNWCRLSHISVAVLNSTEKYALSCLEWNVVMKPTQWQDTIVFLRSCIKMGSVFDPFGYDEVSPSGIMARCLDELINLSDADEIVSQRTASSAMGILALQAVRHSPHRNATDWCPEDDPVINRKPRTIGVAPGADKDLSTFMVRTTAKDLLDSILGPSRQVVIGSRGWWSFWRQPPIVYNLVT